MTKTLLAALLMPSLLAAFAPTLAEAQAGAGLGNPDATVEVTIFTPTTQRFVLDPEIAAMRARQRDSARPAPYRAVSLPVPGLEIADDGPNFGSSFGHSWAGFGIGIAGGGLLGGVITAALVCPGDDSGFCALAAFGGAGLGAMMVAPLGAALATWGFGERRGGTGNFFAALGGAYLGAGIGVGVSAMIANLDWDGRWALSFVGPVVGVFLANIGAAAGYQLSSHGSSAQSERAQGLTIVPTLNPIENGATAGIAGMF